LDNVVSGLTAKVLERYYGGDKSKVPAIDYLGVKPAPVPSPPGAHVLRTGGEAKLTPPISLPSAEHRLRALAVSELNWWHSIVRSEFVVQGTSYIANPLRRVLVPRAGQKIVIRFLGDQPNQHQPDFLAADIRYDVSSRLINLTLFEERQHDAVPLYLQFKITSNMSYLGVRTVP
jgi:fatty acid synthase subunit alpha, fungi type